ncbi:acyl-CoA carboxylase epsilon subunit [Streptomyces sp. NPDC079020]|uniref:acyl-CoA carboxylase epsilon subunit n=1 Tax=Streptomyces sp. NPDC079020 TaxID=3365722 RepID=UPI0037CFF6D1
MLRVVHGCPTPEELAAAVAVVLAALQGSGPAGSGAPTPAQWRRAEAPPSPRVSWRGGR